MEHLRGYDDILNAKCAKHPAGYVYVKPVGSRRYRRQHILIAARALGKPLPKGTSVHHVNEQRDDNRNSNLVICQDEKYHKGLHMKMRVRAAGGDPWRDRICSTCKRLTAIALMGRRREKLSQECKACICARVVKYKAARRRGLRLQAV